MNNCSTKVNYPDTVGISTKSFISASCNSKFNLPLSVILGMVLKLHHCTVLHKVLSVIGLLVIIKLAELLSYLLNGFKIRISNSVITLWFT